MNVNDMDLIPLSNISMFGGKQKTNEVIAWVLGKYHGVSDDKFEAQLEEFKKQWTLPTYRGTLYLGFTSFCNQHVVAFHRPFTREVHGHSIRWSAVHVHEHASKKITCLHYDSYSLKRTCVDQDLFGLYGLLALYRNQSCVWNKTKGKRAVESVDNARRLLVDMQLGILPTPLEISCAPALLGDEYLDEY